MGQERAGKRKHVLFFVACCLILCSWLCGCAHSVRQSQGEQDLRDAKELRGMGDYSASERKTLDVLEDLPQTLGAEALFQMGLLYSLPNNPNADYEKSKGYFETLVTQYPESSRKEEATAWVFALNRIIDIEEESLEIQEKVRFLEEASESREKMLRQLEDQLRNRKRETPQPSDKKLKQLQEELEDREREITEYLESVSQLQNRVIELELQLARFKNIDLTIEQKKRSTTP